MGTIKVVSKKFAGNEDLGVRVLEFDKPDVLECTTLDDLVAIQGEEYCLSQILAQLKIQFRSHTRTKMDAVTEDGEFVNSDETLLALNFSEWKPEVRQRKSAFEKAMAILGTLPPEEREEAFAKFNEINDSAVDELPVD